MAESQEEQYVHAESPHPRSLVHLISKSRAFVLLFALLLQIFLSGQDIGGTFFHFLVRILVILAAVYVTADHKKHFIIGMSLGIPSVVLVSQNYRTANDIVGWISFGLLFLLYVYIIRLMLIQIFFAKVITLNTIGFALCTYILIGTIWVLFYTPVVALDPNAFSVPLLDDGDAVHTLVYFSYVTLTTLGYGDISPVSNLARNLAVLEAITGTLFLAVLISRLVGSYVSSRDR
jgi:hypothetical protein